jgi:hypothetical protein
MSPAKQRLLTISLIVLGILIVGFFGLRAVHAFGEFRRHGPPPPLGKAFDKEPMETDVELIRDWMTIPYISMTYHVHPKAIYEALAISPKGNDEKNLAQLNDDFFSDKPGIVLEMVKAAVQANQPIPTPASP